MTLASGWLLMLPLALLADSAPPEEAASSEGGAVAVRNLIFLAEERPVFLRLQVRSGDRPFDAAWPDSVRTLHAWLDRDGDGTISAKEASPSALAGLVRLAVGGAAVAQPTPAAAEQGNNAKEPPLSLEGFKASLEPMLGPFRIELGQLVGGRTDALFDHLDRDKDEQLTRTELAAIAGSLRKLDLDDNEMISAVELEPFNSPAAMALEGTAAERRARYTAVPPVIELVAGESSLRLARLLLKKYDKGKGTEEEITGRPDGKLSAAEFAIAPEAFSAVDRNRDKLLSTDELRKYLADPPADLMIDVSFPADPAGQATARLAGDGELPQGTQVRQLAAGDFELVIGRVRLDLRVDDGTTTAENARRGLSRQFRAADANKDGYLEGKELAGINGPASPLAGLVEVLDRDADGKLYEKELLEFADRQTEAARARMVLNVSDQGRAIFGILDLDRDRRLSAREVMRTLERISSWDGDRDGRVTADEIPYHFLVNISRGELPGLTGAGGAGVANAAVPAGSMAAPRPTPLTAGPDWFRQMDRNKDGDVSHREFLGPRAQFDRLDRDNDGLIGVEEAEAAQVKAETKRGDATMP